MGRPRRAALAGVHEGGEALEVDLCQVPRQNSGCNTHALEHDPAQRRIGFLAQVDRRQLKLCVPCLLVPWCLPGRMSERDLIPLSASRIAGAGTVEGSGAQSEVNEGDQMHGVEYHRRKWRGCHRKQT
jgi:hypothetical protein